MQVLITHGTVARTRVLHFGRWQLLAAAAVMLLALLTLSGTVYHFVFLKAAREGWPVVSALVRLVVRDELADRERFMRDNLEAMAQRVGEFEARLVQLQHMGERVSTLAGIQPGDLGTAGAGQVPQGNGSPATPVDAGAGATTGPATPAAVPPQPTPPAPGARGGPYVPASLGDTQLHQLQGRLDGLDQRAAMHLDIFTLAGARLSEARLLALLMPTSAPVEGPVGSGFGFRDDPFTGRVALHAGLDFPADNGTPIHAAAGGIVVLREYHPAYGNLIEIHHGNGLLTRYAHCSAFEVPLGALVRRGELIARVGSSGRSTGPHLHFEVLLDGVPQNPARFLAGRLPPALDVSAALAGPTASTPPGARRRAASTPAVAVPR